MRVLERRALLSECGTYRYRLTRTWGPALDLLDGFACWVMLNPSTADHTVDDPTIRRIVDFSARWGYGHAEVVNLYPFRSANPRDARQWAMHCMDGPHWDERDVMMRNVALVAEIAKKAAVVVAAWGAAPWAEEIAEHVVEEITTGEEPWPALYCLGKTKHGAPRHPLYVRRDQPLEEYTR